MMFIGYFITFVIQALAANGADLNEKDNRGNHLVYSFIPLIKNWVPMVLQYRSELSEPKSRI